MKWLLRAFLTLSLLTVAACGSSEEVNKSRATALGWAEAELQWDGEQRMKLLTPDAQKKYKDSQHVRGEAVDPDLKIKQYEMLEWEISEDSYIYQIRYFDEHDEIDVLWTKTLKTDKGWGITNLVFHSNQAKPFVEGKDPNIVKELNP